MPNKKVQLTSRSARNLTFAVSRLEATDMKKTIKMAMPILGPLAAIIVFQATGSVWGLIIVAWAALILFFVL